MEYDTTPAAPRPRRLLLCLGALWLALGALLAAMAVRRWDANYGVALGFVALSLAAGVAAVRGAEGLRFAARALLTGHCALLLLWCGAVAMATGWWGLRAALAGLALLGVVSLTAVLRARP